MNNWMNKSCKTALLTIAASVLVITGCSAAANGDKGQTAPPGQAQPGNAGQGSAAGPTENELDPAPNGSDVKVEKTVTLFFTDDQLMSTYRFERDVEADSEEELPRAALEAWMNGPETEGFHNLMPPEVVIETLEFRDGIAYVSFSPEIRNANLGSSGELFLIEQIALIMQQFGYNSTQILVEGEAEESLLGHVTTDEPIPAPDPEQFDWYEQ